MRPRLVVLLALSTLLAMLLHDAAQGARVRLDRKPIAGKTTTLRLSGLSPGRHVTVGIVPFRSTTRRGVPIGKPRQVPRSGTLRVRFRWPTKYFDCVRSTACPRRAWRANQKAYVLVGQTRLPSLDTRVMSVRTRVRVRKSADRGGRRAKSSDFTRAARIPLGKQCGGFWVEEARISGSGFSTHVEILPTRQARKLGAIPDLLGGIRSNLERCVGKPQESTPAIDDTLRVQLICHAAVAPVVPGVGSLATWDLEAWREIPGPLQSVSPFERCNYPNEPSALRAYEGWIIHSADDTASHKASWLVENQTRRPIPESSDFFCLKDEGKKGPVTVSVRFINAAYGSPRENKTCSKAPPPPPPAPVVDPPTEPKPPTASPKPPAPASTWDEQQGSLGANTFRNPTNASGMGVKIKPYQWVRVSCKIYRPQIQSANPDGYWYRIASAPWNNQYYAVANTFWNGDVPGRKPYVHNTDFAVRDC